jgi:hypothetical protein
MMPTRKHVCSEDKPTWIFMILIMILMILMNPKTVTSAMLWTSFWRMIPLVKSTPTGYLAKTLYANVVLPSTSTCAKLSHFDVCVPVLQALQRIPGQIPTVELGDKTSFVKKKKRRLQPFFSTADSLSGTSFVLTVLY